MAKKRRIPVPNASFASNTDSKTVVKDKSADPKTAALLKKKKGFAGFLNKNKMVSTS